MTKTLSSSRGRRASAHRADDAPPPGNLGELTQLLGGESDRSRRFLGGIAAGALVGAAMAGAALMRRRSPSRREEG